MIWAKTLLVVEETKKEIIVAIQCKMLLPTAWGGPKKPTLIRILKKNSYLSFNAP